MSANSRARSIGRLLLALVGAVAAAVLGRYLFYDLPESPTELLGVLLVLGAALVGARLAAGAADRLFPAYNVAEVAVEGPIGRDGGGGPVPGDRGGTAAGDAVEQIERADGDRNARALLVRLNTPGGEVVPSDDIRRAAAEFDGPTLAYATDTCASGGYWIASGCDELWARENSVVGSIGVIGSRLNAADLAERLGVRYERLAAGEYKDAGTPLKELSADERAYLQGIVDDLYESFVRRVAEGRGMEPAEIRATEARVYLGEEAREIGLVDDLGDRGDAEERLEERLRTDVTVAEFEPSRPPLARLVAGGQRIAYAFGAGLAGRLDADEGLRFRLR